MDIDIKKLEQEKQVITRKMHEYYLEKTRDAIEKNKGFIGKTFKKEIENIRKTTLYCKIIDVDKENEFRMLSLCFCYPFEIVEDILMEINSIGWFCNSMTSTKYTKEIDSYTEITNEEFERVYDEFIQKIKEIK